jgi:hypothetical protein
MKNTLPAMFKPLLWSYHFNEINPEDHKRTIIVNTINYGNWTHWQWLARYYGKPRLRKIIAGIPASEFRASALKLISLLLGLKKIKYASRSSMVSGKADPVQVSQL